MQYMLMFFDKDGPDAPEPDMEAWKAYINPMFEAGVATAGEELHAGAMATTVRLRDGRRQVQDGPFVDSKEQLGGYVIIDVPDLDTALAHAAKAPCALTGAVEVRPVVLHSEDDA
ncbi:MAG: YciI family protein [Pseudomonadota bacterium]